MLGRITGPFGVRGWLKVASFTDPPAWVADVGPDDDIAVRGRVRKRFVRAGASSRPFTDVVVEHAVRGGRRRQIEQLVARAVEQLAEQ